MDDTALLLSLGFARPSAREAAESFRQVFPGVSARGGGRVRAFDERTTIGLMLGQALGRNAPCKEAVRRAQLELGMDVSASTAARACDDPATAERLERIASRSLVRQDGMLYLDVGRDWRIGATANFIISLAYANGASFRRLCARP